MRFNALRGTFGRLVRHASTGEPALDADVVVIGAGVVGLAIGRELALAGRQVLIMDSGPAIGTQTSSRNSEVIHAGIYYSPGSIKAQTCEEGRRLLYSFCEAHDVPFRQLGKILVAASDAQLGDLETTRRLAASNGVELQPLSASELRDLEPELEGVAGLYSPTTGIVDSHSFMEELHRQIEELGGMVVLNSCVEGGEVGGHVKTLVVRDTAPNGEAVVLRCASVVNSAGLWAQSVGASLRGTRAAAIPPAYYAKGRYFTMTGPPPPFRHLVYPLPSAGGLGVHLTLDLGGAARFGPDVQWLAPGTPPDALDYGVDPGAAPEFERAVRSYWSGLPGGVLLPGYAGVRPKVTPPGHPPGDFVVHGPELAGAPGFVALYGIESPGLTASLSLARRVAALLA